MWPNAQDLVTFTEGIFNRRLHFYAVYVIKYLIWRKWKSINFLKLKNLRLLSRDPSSKQNSTEKGFDVVAWRTYWGTSFLADKSKRIKKVKKVPCQ